MRIFTLSLLSFLILISFGCMKKVDIEAEKAEILKILAADDQELLDGISKDDTLNVEYISIGEGELNRITGVQSHERNRKLMEKGKFVKIENLDGPVIHVSPDGIMAWMALKTKFVIKYDSSGVEKEWEGIEARLEVYEKKDNEWVAVAGVQTH